MEISSGNSVRVKLKSTQNTIYTDVIRKNKTKQNNIRLIIHNTIKKNNNIIIYSHSLVCIYNNNNGRTCIRTDKQRSK